MVLESGRARKAIRKLPLEILKHYEKWKDIVMLSGPQGLRNIKGFHDEPLRGQWRGYRFSRLNIKYRVIYKIVADKVYMEVFDINPHEY